MGTLGVIQTALRGPLPAERAGRREPVASLATGLLQRLVRQAKSFRVYWREVPPDEHLLVFEMSRRSLRSRLRNTPTQHRHRNVKLASRLDQA